MSTKEMIELYLQWGFNVIPLKPKSKIPAIPWKEYQTKKFSREKLEEYFSKTENFAVITGEISRNLAVLDFDKSEYYEKFKKCIPERYLDTLIVRTGKGWHVYYYTEKPIKTSLKEGIDIKGEGGCVVLPPSIHPETGRRYEAINMARPLKISMSEWAKISKLALSFLYDEKINDNFTNREEVIDKIVEILNKFWTYKHRNKLTNYFFGYMLNRGVDFKTMKEILERVLALNDDEEKSQRRGVLRHMWDKQEELDIKGWTGLKEYFPEQMVENLEVLVDYLVGRSYNSEKNPQNKEKNKDDGKKKRTFVYTDDDLYLAVWDGRDNYKFAHLAMDGTIELLDYAEKDGQIYYPKEIEKNENGTMLPIKYPTFDIVNAPDIETNELFELLKSHIWKYVDLNDDDLEMSIFYILHTYFYRKSNTTAYLRFLGDTGKGKSRMLKVIGNLCFYPLKLGGNSSRSAIMRVQERYQGTLVLDEADFRGDKEDDFTTYINSGFEKDNPAILSGQNDADITHIFTSYSPKLFAMRHPFRDSATEGRTLSIEPEETYRTDIPAVLPLKYEEEVKELRDTLARWALKNWSKVKLENQEFIQRLPIEPRLKQLATPLSSILPLFGEGMNNKFINWLMRRQEEIAKHRANTDEGYLFNTILDLVDKQNEDTFEDEEDEQRPKVISTGMLRELMGLSPRKINMLLEELGFEVKKQHVKIDGKRSLWHVIRLKSTRRWVESWRRYKWGEELTEVPEILRDPKREYESVDKFKMVADGANGAVHGKRSPSADMGMSLKYDVNKNNTNAFYNTAPTATTATTSILAVKILEDTRVALPEGDASLKKGEFYTFPEKIANILIKGKKAMPAKFVMGEVDGEQKVIGTLVDIYGATDKVAPEKLAEFLENLPAENIIIPENRRL